MDIFLARQPIFNKYLEIYGYELLYRHSQENSFAGIDDNQATSELIHNSFLVMGLNDLTGETRAFINFSKELIAGDIPYLLPSQGVVLEILERDEVTPATIEACKKLKANGYTLALDDFCPNNNSIALIEVADIVKIEFATLSHSVQHNLLKKYKSKVKFLAEKIETREEFKLAVKMGYELFQGYFFSKPAMIKAKEISSLNANLINIIDELNSHQPRYEIISNIIESDLGLTYKLLKLANSAFAAPKYKIKSIPQALTYLGIKEIYQWVSLMLLRDMQFVENAELVKLSLLRGKLMDLLAGELNAGRLNADYMFTGMLSSADVLLNKRMDEVLGGLPLNDNVKQALRGEDNDLRKMLDCIISYERADWAMVKTMYPINHIGHERFLFLYIEALKWANSLYY